MTKTIQSSDIQIQANSNMLLLTHSETSLKANYLGNDYYEVTKTQSGYLLSRKMGLSSGSWSYAQELTKEQLFDDAHMLTVMQNQACIDWIQSVAENQSFDALIVDFNRTEWMAQVFFNEGTSVNDLQKSAWKQSFAETLTIAMSPNDATPSIFTPQVSKPFGESFYPLLHRYIMGILNVLAREMPEQIQIFDKVYDPKKENITGVFNQQLEAWGVPFRVFLAESGDRYSCFYGQILDEKKDSLGKRTIYFGDFLFATRMPEFVYGVTNGNLDCALFVRSAEGFISNKMKINSSDQDREVDQRFYNDSMARGEEATTKDFIWLVQQHEARHRDVNEDIHFLTTEFMGFLKYDYQAGNQNDFNIFFEMEELDAEIACLQKICELQKTNPERAETLLFIFYQKNMGHVTWQYQLAIKALLDQNMPIDTSGKIKINWTDLDNQVLKIQSVIENRRKDLAHVARLLVLQQIHNWDGLEAGVDYDGVKLQYNTVIQKAISQNFDSDTDPFFAETKINGDWISRLDLSQSMYGGKTAYELLQESDRQIRTDLNQIFQNASQPTRFF